MRTGTTCMGASRDFHARSGRSVGWRAHAVDTVADFTRRRGRISGYADRAPVAAASSTSGACALSCPPSPTRPRSSILPRTATSISTVRETSCAIGCKYRRTPICRPMRAGIPTGEFAPVGGTPFDFRTMRAVRPPDAPPQRYDNTYVLAPSDGGLRKAARLESSGESGMEIWSTEPGIQFFDAGTMRPIDRPRWPCLWALQRAVPRAAALSRLAQSKRFHRLRALSRPDAPADHRISVRPAVNSPRRNCA